MSLSHSLQRFSFSQPSPAAPIRNVFPLVALQKAPSPSPDSKTVISYEDTGENEPDMPTILFAPGMGELRQSYRLLAPMFDRVGYRVLCMDLRATGDSSTDFGTFGVEEIASDMIAVLNHANVNTPAIIVGNSLSGAAACVVGAKHSARVYCILLINGVIREMPADKFYRPLASLMLQPQWGAQAWVLFWRTLFTSMPPDDLHIYSEYLKSHISYEPRMHALKEFGKSNKDLAWKVCPQITKPVFAIFGGKDPEYLSPQAEPKIIEPQFQSAKVFKAAVIDGLGHYPHVEDPQGVYELIKEFLAQIK